LTASAIALSKLSPTVPIDGAAPMSSSPPVYVIEVY